MIRPTLVATLVALISTPTLAATVQGPLASAQVSIGSYLNGGSESVNVEAPMFFNDGGPNADSTYRIPSYSFPFPVFVVGGSTSGSSANTAATSAGSNGTSAASSGLPSSTATALANTSTSATPNTAVTVISAGSAINGCNVENPAYLNNNPQTPNTAIVVLDWSGGTPASTQDDLEPLAPGATVPCRFNPSKSVTMWSSTASVRIYGGVF